MGSRDIPGALKKKRDENPSKGRLLSPEEVAAEIEEIKREHGEDIEKAIVEVSGRLKRQIEWAREAEKDPKRQEQIVSKKIDYGKLMGEIDEAEIRMNNESMEECKEAVLLKIAKEVSEGNKIGRYQNFISSAVSSYFCGEQQGELGKFFSFYGELLKIEKRRKKVGPNVARADGKTEKGGAAEKNPEEKRKEQIEAAVAAEFDEFVQKDLDQKFDRLTKGTTISPEELTTLKQRFLDERENIINATTEVLENRINKFKKQFNLDDIKNKDANLVIWGELLRMAYGKYWTPDSKELVFGPTVNPVDGTEDMTGPEAIGLHIMAKPGFDNLNQLDLSKEEEKKLTKEEQAAERDNRIKELARKFIDQFTVHGVYEKGVFQLKSDLDGESFLLLLKLAGFDVREDNVEYVEKGQSTKRESSFQGDTSSEPRKHGFVVMGLGKIVIVDHHEEGVSDRDSCATSLLFDGLKKFGLFEDRMTAEEMNALEQYVEFVKKHDNQEYSKEESEKIFKYYTANVPGLMRYLPKEDLYGIFVQNCQSGKKFDPYVALSEDFLKKINFPEIDGRKADYKRVKHLLNESKAKSNGAIVEISKSGLVAHTGGGRHGDVLIDTGRFNSDGTHTRKVGWGWPAARAKKHGAYIVWDPERHFFQVFSEKEIKFDLGQGKNIRGHYILFSGSEKDPLKVTLTDILAALSGDPNYQISGKIQAALDADREKQQREREKLLAGQQREKKIKEISQILFADRKRRDPSVLEMAPGEDDLKVAKNLLKTKEEQESLEKIFSKEQYKTFLKLKEAFKRAVEELSENYSKEIPEQLKKDLEKDLSNFIRTELIGNRNIFSADKADELKRLAQEGNFLDALVSELKIKF